MLVEFQSCFMVDRRFSYFLLLQHLLVPIKIWNCHHILANMVYTWKLHISRISKVLLCQPKLDHGFSRKFRHFHRARWFLTQGLFEVLFSRKLYILEHDPLSYGRFLNMRQVNVCNNIGVLVFIRLSVKHLILSDLKRLLILFILRSTLGSFLGFLFHMVWVYVESFIVQIPILRNNIPEIWA